MKNAPEHFRFVDIPTQYGKTKSRSPNIKDDYEHLVSMQQKQSGENLKGAIILKYEYDLYASNGEKYTSTENNQTSIYGDEQYCLKL
ncbi:MAG TPA: hypothetical protein VNK44_08395 [Candidatus Nitrosotenuis sp.]|nr:hypothetical protein [Candidatus Nitrosotenuis sp.]